MIVTLLKDSYLNSDQLYDDFLNDKITSDLDHFSDTSYNFDELKPFPLYINYKNDAEREVKFLKLSKQYMIVIYRWIKT